MGAPVFIKAIVHSLFENEPRLQTGTPKRVLGWKLFNVPSAPWRNHGATQKARFGGLFEQLGTIIYLDGFVWKGLKPSVCHGLAV